MNEIHKTDGDHLVVKMYNPTFDDHVEIDCGIAPLIQAIWNAGLVTFNSCQDRTKESTPKPGIAWIEFADAGNAETVLSIIDGGEVDIHDADQFNLTAVPMEVGDEDEAPDIRLSISMRYPHALTDTLTERMQGFAEYVMEQEQQAADEAQAAGAVRH